MAASASGFSTTSFIGASVRPFLHKGSGDALRPRSLPANAFQNRGVVRGVRSELETTHSQDTITSRVSSASVLEQLKVSAADRWHPHKFEQSFTWPRDDLLNQHYLFRILQELESPLFVNFQMPLMDWPAVVDILSLQWISGYMKERSSIAVIGLSVHTAPVEMREKLAVPEAQWPRAIGELCSLNHIEEAAVLSTCNRMEIYVVALSWHRGIREVTEWMSKTSGIPVSELRQHLFLLRDSDATRHLFQVSAGLDSLVLGEGQILAQVRQVVKVGQGGRGLGKNIDRLFKDAITAGKRVRTETNIASGAVSVSSAAVELALMKIPNSESLAARMLVIGAGKMGKLVIKHLAAKGCKKVVVVNRSVERVEAIRLELKEIEIIYRPFTEMLAAAAEADVVFTSTASETPLFLKEDVETLPQVSKPVGGLRLFLDISVPRNVGSCVSAVKSARVYNVDDLKEVVEANKEDRLRKAMEAEAIITEELKRFEAWRDSLETVPTIKKLRSYADRIRAAELEKCFQKIGEDALTKKIRRAVDDLSNGIVNKLLHGPLQHLRCDGSDSRTLDETLENMHALNRMFSLDTEKSIIEQKIKAKVEKTQN